MIVVWSAARRGGNFAYGIGHDTRATEPHNHIVLVVGSPNGFLIDRANVPTL